MKHSEEYQRITNLVDNLLTVSSEEIQRREAEYQKKVDANRTDEGPKRGTRTRETMIPPSASDLQAIGIR